MRPRLRHVQHVQRLLASGGGVALLGPRQVGKTTLARLVGNVAASNREVTWFDLEDVDDLARLAEPKLALQDRTGLIVLDEIQRRPDLFPILRVLMDRPQAPSRFLILGSSSPDLLQQSSETLAGRLMFHRLDGFAFDEIAADEQGQLWLRGGFPRSFLAESDEISFEWRRAFIQTFLERDLAQMGVTIPAATMSRFWRMLAHVHGGVWSASRFANSFGVSAPTVRRYVDALTDTFVVRQLAPWHENTGKRQVKAPKIYISDTGLLHALLGLRSRTDVESHPTLGSSWEWFALQQMMTRLGADESECFFWATHAGAELDLLVVRGNQRLGFEFKRTSAPKTTKSMHSAMETLKLDSLDVVHAGDHTFELADGIRAVAMARLLDDVRPL